MQQPMRSYPDPGAAAPGPGAGTTYRYGYNGKEMDNEWYGDAGTGLSGVGNSYDYGFRIYNPRYARFLSVDPLTDEYPWYTPYQFAGNMPIWAIDLDGAEPLLPPIFGQSTTLPLPPWVGAAPRPLPLPPTSTYDPGIPFLMPREATRPLEARPLEQPVTEDELIREAETQKKWYQEIRKKPPYQILRRGIEAAENVLKRVPYLPDPENTQEEEKEEATLYIYRVGKSNKDATWRPRLADVQESPPSPNAGISTFTTPEDAVRALRNSREKKMTVQKLSVATLIKEGFMLVPDVRSNGSVHVAIQPGITMSAGLLYSFQPGLTINYSMQQTLLHWALGNNEGLSDRVKKSRVGEDTVANPNYQSKNK